MYLSVIWFYLILCVCVPVKVREKAQRICFSHQDEVCRPVGQMGGWRKTRWALWTWAWHTGERDTLEPAFNGHPLTWDKNNGKRLKIIKMIKSSFLNSVHDLCIMSLYCRFTQAHFGTYMTTVKYRHTTYEPHRDTKHSVIPVKGL